MNAAGRRKTERSAVPAESRRRERTAALPAARASDSESPAGSLPPRDSTLSRAALPADASAAPPLPAGFDEALAQGLEMLGMDLDVPARAAIDAHARLLFAWNEAINLTGHRSAQRMALENVVDSLTALSFVPSESRLLDIGSGSGHPGLPLAVARPVRHAALLERVTKKARFLDVAARAAMAAIHAAGGRSPTITAIGLGAEEMATRPGEAGAWDVVTVRAVAALARVVGLALPFLRPGGRLIAWKRDDGSGALTRELRDARKAIQLAGGGPPEVHPVAVAGLADHRLIVVHRRPLT